MGYDFKVQYKPGLQNTAVDSLSRMGLRVHLASLSALTILDVEIVRSEVKEGDCLCKIQADLELDMQSHPKFSIIQGNLLHKD